MHIEDRLAVPVFSRKADRAMGGSEARLQQGQYRSAVALGRSALEIWDGRPLGGHSVPSPNLSAFANVKQVIHPIWTVHKSAEGLRISSIAHPVEEPYATVSPTYEGAKITLNGRELSATSSYADLQLAKTLLGCADQGG